MPNTISDSAPEWMFAKALVQLKDFSDCLIRTAEDQTQLRVAHTLWNRREFAMMSCTSSIDGGETEHYLGILWQCKIAPRKAMCLIFRQSINVTLQFVCTCDPMISVNTSDRERCAHSVTFFLDHYMVARVKIILQERHRKYFPSVTIQHESMLLAFQLKGSVQRDLSARTKRIIESWFFSLVFDPQLKTLVAVYKCRSNTYDCQKCWSDSGRRGHCSHEYSCV